MRGQATVTSPKTSKREDVSMAREGVGDLHLSMSAFPP